MASWTHLLQHYRLTVSQFTCSSHLLCFLQTEHTGVYPGADCYRFGIKPQAVERHTGGCAHLPSSLLMSLCLPIPPGSVVGSHAKKTRGAVARPANYCQGSQCQEQVVNPACLLTFQFCQHTSTEHVFKSASLLVRKHQSVCINGAGIFR
ncbi:hypothetical protein INR49_029129 [Caranx melampygus]|nr:hypothetical protein INR49_029129 [Caranx melampygus]